MNNKIIKSFTKLYMSGLSIKKCAGKLRMTERQAWLLKKHLQLPSKLWERYGVPSTLSNDTISIIYGTMLGDATIRNTNGSKILALSHGKKQKRYIEYKRKLLKELKPNKIRNIKSNWDGYMFETVPLPQLEPIYNIFYKNGTKQVSNTILKKLTPQSIALWFMDDGSNHGHYAILHVCSFNKTSLNNIVSYFKKKYKIQTKIITSSKNYPLLYIGGKNAIKLKSLIGDYIIPSMKYKIDFITGIGTRPRWSKNEIDFLIKNFKSYRQKEVVKLSLKLKRPFPATVKKIQQLKRVGLL